LMMSLWDALRMNMMISYQELVRTFPSSSTTVKKMLERALTTQLYHMLKVGFHWLKLIVQSFTTSPEHEHLTK
ncbi:hypothetical protein ACOY6D_23915, partial [Enterobacter hormaechei]